MARKKLPKIAGKDFMLPFSVAILTGSLETIGIKYRKAFRIASEIGDYLEQRNIKSITRDKLREFVYKQIKMDVNKEMADKYRKFRKIMQLKKPLIILLGGSTGSGKNTVSVELAHRLDITTVITSDAIREVMRTILSKEISPMIHTSSYLAKDNLWMPISKDKVGSVVAFREQALRVNAGIKGIISRSIKERTTLIINGVHIIPDLIKEEDYEKADIIKIFIYVKNKKEHKERFYMRGRSSEDRNAARYLDSFTRIRDIQKYIVKGARKAGYPCINNIKSS
ncbi:MAG: zeta toxin family protein [Elusimicrobia bacterium]|jgi:2-phosphoglycerate kinase|nr:zeta toxin family protein [Elusimicrobiota bacterium]